MVGFVGACGKDGREYKSVVMGLWGRGPLMAEGVEVGTVVMGVVRAWERGGWSSRRIGRWLWEMWEDIGSYDSMGGLLKSERGNRARCGEEGAPYNVIWCWHHQEPLAVPVSSDYEGPTAFSLHPGGRLP